MWKVFVWTASCLTLSFPRRPPRACGTPISPRGPRPRISTATKPWKHFLGGSRVPGCGQLAGGGCGFPDGPRKRGLDPLEDDALSASLDSYLFPLRFHFLTWPL